ncbi:MAG: DNA primase [Firmicutes bacterium]|nr:DNA primase [Bacillota bacterium]
MAFRENIVDEIKSRCNIVDVIGRVVVLKKTGGNYKGLCPFHNEKTPSFIVSETRQTYKCFGCGEGGDVIGFVQRYHNLDFQEAVEKLAEQYGISLDTSQFASEGKKNALYEMNREAAAFFYKRFRKDANKANAYMMKRGLDVETLRKFGIGFADDEWDSLWLHLKEKGFAEESLMELGLISQGKKDPTKYYDRFRSRVMFPIINTRGKVIGFGGRTLGDDEPKYLNSPESTVFLKKNNLYGLNLTRQDINREDCAILVEGYMDVISLYQHGIRNVAASLGTALTENQAAMLKRYTKNVVLAYDADAAGQKAALRGVDVLYAAGCKAKVLMIPEGKDPDDYIKLRGKDAFLRLVEEALPLVDFKLHLLKKKTDLKTTEGRISYLQESAAILRALSPMEADAYVGKIAAEAGISEGAIRLEVFGNHNKQRPVNAAPAGDRSTGQKKPEGRRPGRGTDMLERNLIRLALLKGEYIPKIQPYKEVFEKPVHKRIFQLIESLYRGDGEIDLRLLEDSLEDSDRTVLKDILENVRIAGRDKEVFRDCVHHIQSNEKTRREEDIIMRLSLLDDETDRGAIEELTKELMELQKQSGKGDVENGF